jgi:predicted CxxxxCH...CXXCH cytochrome family protein
LCHGNSPNTGGKTGSPAHAVHVVGIHQDDIFTGSIGKLAAGSTGSVSHGLAAQATTIDCYLCHFTTLNVAQNDQSTACVSCHASKPRGNGRITNLANHVNGVTNVAFNPIALVSKAQVRDNSFTSYTAAFSRTTYKAGAGSYDTAKKAFNTSTMWTAGAQGQGSCANISCHNGKTVTWNASITCLSCHQDL